MRLAAGLGLSVALAALAGAAAAQEGGPIRSGEHADFSRIVMTIEPTTEWSLETGGRRATLFFPGRALDFTTGDLFVRMPRTRVLAVETARSAAGTTVSVQLGCDCRVCTRFVGARYLALDVQDRDAATMAARPPVWNAQPDPTPAGAPPAEADAQAATSVDTAAATDADALAEAEAEALAAAEAEAAQLARENEAIASAQQILIEQIERAANQGLIQLAGEEPLAELRETPSLAEAAPAAPPAPETAAPPAVAPAASPAADLAALEPADPLAEREGERQVIATTVFDRDSSAAAAARLARQLAPAECLPDTALDVGRWTNGTPLHHQVPQLQRLVVGEFDRPNPTAVRDLARLYVRFGFGAEAEDMIESFGAEFPERALLTDLARVIERRPLAEGGPLSLRAACPGRHGLWLAIAGQPAALADPRLFATVQTAFADMPPDLRRLVAPPLVEGLLDNGRVAEAALMFDVADRSGAPADPDLRLAAARLAAVEGRAHEGEAALAGLIAENAWNASEALQHLVRIRMDRGGEVPQPWLTDLAAAALERRSTPAEWDLRALRAEALARNGALGGALGEVVALRDDLPARAAASDELAVRLMARADPARTGGAAYAEAILSHERMIGPAPVNDPPRIAIAGRMTDLGLPNAALGLLEPAVDREVAAARLLAARVYVGMGRPDPALALLDRLPGEDAGRLRARAHAQRGEYDLALAEMSAAAPAEEALPYAWASGDWDRVAAGTADPERLAMAAFMQARGEDASAGAAPPSDLDPASPAAAFRAPLPSLEEPSLRAARELLDTGRQVGGLVQGLLGTPVTATP
jgi:hypothetical protein